MTREPKHTEMETPPPGNDSEVLAFPATPAQESFFYLERLFPSQRPFNVPVRFLLEGAIDVRLLQQAFDAMIARQESLRTCLQEDDGALLQVIKPSVRFGLELLDISHLSGDSLHAETERLGSVEARLPFDLGRAPLIRGSLLRLGPDRHMLHVTVHHAVADGWSIGIITDELSEFYNAFLTDREPALEPLAVQFADFSVWQREFLGGPAIKEHVEWWKQRLLDHRELELPTDRPRPKVKSWDGDIVSRILPRALSDRAARLAREQGATIFHVFLAAFKAVASRYTGIEDITVGSPVVGRTSADLEPVIGSFINTLLLRTDLTGDPSFRDLVGRVRDTATEAITHQDVPFSRIVEELQPRRDPGRNPLFQVNFTHQRDFVREVSFGGARLTPIPSRSPGAIFDLHFFMVERADGWRASCDFSTDLFDRETALRLLDHFEVLLEAGTASPDSRLSRLPILPETEQSLLRKWSGHCVSYPSGKTLGQLFLEAGQRHADRVAVTHDGQHVTFRQLVEAAGMIANRLRAGGVRPGDRVSLCAPSVPEMVAAQAGILIVGGVCVPLDPEYPAGRLRLMLENSSSKIVLTTRALASLFDPSNARVQLLEPLDPAAEAASTAVQLAPETTAGDASHLYFTSGSAGQPKGVLIPHRAIARLILGGDFMEFGCGDSFLQAAPISFDAATLEIWMPLLHGGRIVLTGSGGASLPAIARAVREQKVTCLWLTAGLFQTMVDEHLDDLRGLRCLLAGGDVLSPAHVRRAMEGLPGTRLINGYGPTENTTFTCCHQITREDLARPSVPIGRPVGNTTVWILDEQMRPVPVGIPGELFTGGDGLAIGYLDTPDLTSAKFPVIDGERLYRTGDRCRWLPGGLVEFLGRDDHQVKVRGFRIETGEVEAALGGHPSVARCKVAARGTDAASKRLLAWIVPAPGPPPEPPSLRRFLEQRLPAHLIPSAIMVVDSLPVNPNGKIDTNALPDPEFQPGGAGDRPATETETRLAAMWSELLGTPPPGRDDDWFDLGGHSLLALRLFSRIHREFGRSLPLSALLANPTVRTLGLLLDGSTAPDAGSAAGNESAVIVKLNNGESCHPPLFAVHGGDGATLFYRELAGLLPRHPFHAIESPQLGSNGEIRLDSITETAAAYLAVVRRLQPQGPYRLAGYSFGGVVAWEMACQLRAAGQRVDFLALFDTLNPATATRCYRPWERAKVFWRQHRHLSAPNRCLLLAARFIEGAGVHLRVKRELAAAKAAGPAEAHSDLRRIQLREAHLQAMRAYRPGPLHARAHLFKVRFPGDKHELPADYGWSSLARGGLTVREVDGAHLTLFESGHVRELATAIETALHEIQSHES